MIQEYTLPTTTVVQIDAHQAIKDLLAHGDWVHVNMTESQRVNLFRVLQVGYPHLKISTRCMSDVTFRSRIGAGNCTKTYAYMIRVYPRAAKPPE